MNPDSQSNGDEKQPVIRSHDQTSSPEQSPPAPEPSLSHLESPPTANSQPNLPDASITSQEDHFFRSDPSIVNQSALVPASTPVSSDSPTAASQPADNVYSWSAVEFIAHEKASNWYVLFGVGSLLVIALTVVITRDIFSIIVAVIVCGIFGFAAGRQPREMNYALDEHGIAIGSRQYAYREFRGFSVHPEGHLHSLTFVPLKRFMPPVSMYFTPADEDRILGVLNNHLPIEEHRNDPLDHLMNRIRF